MSIPRVIRSRQSEEGFSSEKKKKKKKKVRKQKEKKGTRANQVSAGPVSEVVKHAVAVCLKHFRVDVEAGVPELRDLLGEELHPVRRVAKDNGLVDLKLGEQGVEAVDLLPLLHVGIELRHSAQGKLVHQVNDVRVLEPPCCKVLHSQGEGGREEENLASWGGESEEFFNNLLELGREELVRLKEGRD